jgi:hypothetical protein
MNFLKKESNKKNKDLLLNKDEKDFLFNTFYINEKNEKVKTYLILSRILNKDDILTIRYSNF